MTNYYVVAAHPKSKTNHLNSQFKIYREDEKKFTDIGWKSIGDIIALMKAGHNVLTGKLINKAVQAGAAVEVELRIAKNDTQYKISDMPDA